MNNLFFVSFKRNIVLGASIAVLVMPSVVLAEPLPFFHTIPDGRAYFDTRVNDANGALYTQVLSGLTDDTNSWA